MVRGRALSVLPLRYSFDPDCSLYAKELIRLEQDVFAQHLAGSGQLYVYHTRNVWSQIKSAGSASRTHTAAVGATTAAPLAAAAWLRCRAVAGKW